jgi:NADH-quinone oxidoreductase subunit L
VPGWREAIVVIGVSSAVLGSLMALVSTDLKRVLAYSTISQLGYLFYAVGVGAIFASQFHLLSHALFKALLFLGAGAVIHATGTRDLGRLGGLGAGMPFVRGAFVIGGLALVGVPVLNGFWSKDLILETGLTDGSGWAFLIMLCCAGLTSLYTTRLIWRVFFGPPRGGQRMHDATRAMRVALLPLAAGTLASSLLVGPLAALLSVGWAPLLVVLSSPTTLAGLVVIGLGAAAWRWRERLTPVATRLAGVRRAANADFGFEWLDVTVARITLAAAGAVRRTQTGRLNWNMAAQVGGLCVILAVLAIGGPNP